MVRTALLHRIRQTILVVDGDPARAAGVARNLNGAYQIHAATTLQDARTLLPRLTPDLIILSLESDEAAALHFVAEVRAWSIAPVLPLVRQVSEATAIQAITLRVTALLKTPCAIKAVAEQVRELLADGSPLELLAEQARLLFASDGVMDRRAVPHVIAALASPPTPPGVSVILVAVEASGAEDLLYKEKMCPVLGIVKYRTFTEAVEITRANLSMERRGHTVAIHSHSSAHIEYAGRHLQVGRVLVNQVSATMAGGSFANGLAPSTTLGCGSWGNNSLSGNLAYTHPMNVTRIVSVIEGGMQPADEVIWA